MARKKNPEVHVDINSHNFADNPRAIMDGLGRLSQRTHRTKAGDETKKPSPRLKARRAKNTKAGYFPNPEPKPSMVARYWVFQEHTGGKDFVCACKVKQTAEIIAAMLQKMAQPGVKFTVHRAY